MKKKITVIALVAILITALSIAIGYLIHVNNSVSKWDNLLYPGTIIGNIDLSGKSKDEAIDILNEKYGKSVVKKRIEITAQDKKYIVDYSKLSPVYNIEDCVNNAIKYGKNLALFEKYKLIQNGKARKMDLKFTFDDKPITAIIASMEKDINKEPENASITMDSTGKFIITAEKNGYKLNGDKLKKDVIAKINGDPADELLTLNAIVDTVVAEITAEKLNTIDREISSFSTDFSTSASNRANNITLATKAINGKLVMPGEDFSFNDVVGERTTSKGYQAAPVIIGNLVDSGIGGGICQVSTTLYNAITRANILATERYHHTLQSHYIGLGMDATVDWGSLDYKFKNTLDFPIYIQGYTQNGRIYFNVYANSSLGKRTYNLVNEVYETINSKVTYQDDATKAEGYQLVTQPGYTGYRVRVFKQTFENGKLIDSIKISDDYYAPVNEIIVRGTKKS